MFDWIISIINSLGLPGVFGLMAAENIFPPIPSELIMPLAGFLAGQGEMHIVAVIVAGTLGSVAGTMLWFWLGRAVGADRLRAMTKRHGRWLAMRPSDIDNAIDWFERHGAAAVFFGRMIPAIRTLISIPAGVARMPIGRYLAYTTAGSLIWTSLLAVAGMVMEDHYEAVQDWVDPVSKVVVGGIILVYLYRVITWKPE